MTMKKRNIITLLTVVSLTVLVGGCSKSTPEPTAEAANASEPSPKASASLQVGGIYSTIDGDGGFGVVKLLAHEKGICHARIYKQKFSTRPTTVDVGSLSLGSLWLGKPGDDPDSHYPIISDGFFEWQPVLITTATVTPDELEGYMSWKQRISVTGGGSIIHHRPPEHTDGERKSKP